jgi:hypothetical protein
MHMISTRHISQAMPTQGAEPCPSQLRAHWPYQHLAMLMCALHRIGRFTRAGTESNDRTQ